MQIPRRKALTGNIAVCSVGLDTYWKQFPGLLDEMKRKTGVLLKKLEKRYIISIVLLKKVKICLNANI